WTKADDELPEQVRAWLAGGMASPAGETTDPGATGVARRLFDQRFEPLEAQLRDVRHLIVLPSDALRGIPLEALTERFRVSYAPSGTMLARLREQRPEAPALRRLLAVGDPVFRKAEDRLPGTRREVEAVAALFPQADRLLGADAAKPELAALEGELARYDVLHLATHGV